MITVDGEAVSPGADDGDEDARSVRAVRLELKLYKALAALDPPHELSVILHGRIARQLRALRCSGAVDQEVRQVADLTDDELRQASGIIRAIRALPSWEGRGLQGSHSFRVVLGGYALDVVDEMRSGDVTRHSRACRLA